MTWSRGVVAAGHPLTAEAGCRRPARGRQRGRRRGRGRARVVRDREPAHRARRRGLHARPRGRRSRWSSTSSSPSAGSTAPSAAPSWSRSRSTSPPRAPRCSTSARPRAGSPGCRRAWSRRSRGSAASALAELAAPAARMAREGVRDHRRAGVLPRDPDPDPHPLRGGPGDLRARRPRPARGRSLHASRTSATPSSCSGPRGRSPSTAARSAPGGRGLGAGAWRHARPRRPRAPIEPVSREPVRAAYRGREMLTNPPPSSGGILIAYALALLERLGDTRSRARRRGDGGGAGGAHGRVPRGPATPTGSRERFLDPPRSTPPPRPWPRAGRAAQGPLGPVDRARIDHPHHRRRRRGPLRQRHLLERDRLGPGRARDRRPRQQHARRGGPQPDRLPPPRARARGCPR